MQSTADGKADRRRFFYINSISRGWLRFIPAWISAVCAGTHTIRADADIWPVPAVYFDKRRRYIVKKKKEPLKYHIFQNITFLLKCIRREHPLLLIFIIMQVILSVISPVFGIYIPKITLDLVMGSGQIFGVTLPENFRRPFFSRNIAEFWRRWHVTLGTWFKDYVFYPVSMAKPMKKLTSWGRKRLGPHYGPLLAGSVALFCVWLGNGLWHGAGWHFIFFGMYHFFWILLENLTEPLALRWAERFHVNRECLPYRGFQIARTAVLVCIGELFFRADGLRAGLAMFQKMVTEFSLTTLRDGTIFSLGLDKKDCLVVFLTLVVVFVVEVLQERGHHIRKELSQRSVAVQWLVGYGLILGIVVFGAYGIGYVPVDPIYAQF